MLLCRTFPSVPSYILFLGNLPGRVAWFMLFPHFITVFHLFPRIILCCHLRFSSDSSSYNMTISVLGNFSFSDLFQHLDSLLPTFSFTGCLAVCYTFLCLKCILNCQQKYRYLSGTWPGEQKADSTICYI